MIRRALVALGLALTLLLGLSPAPANAMYIAPGCGRTLVTWKAQEGVVAIDMLWVQVYTLVCYNSAGYITSASMQAWTGTTGPGNFAGYGGRVSVSPYAVINSSSTLRSGYINGTAQACFLRVGLFCNYGEDFRVTFRAIAPAVDTSPGTYHWLLIWNYAFCTNSTCQLRFHA